MKWYSGGKDRGDEAIKIIDELLTELQSNVNNRPLEDLLTSYKKEIIVKNSSIPLLFNRMNLEISKTIRSYGIKLSDVETKNIKELMSLSNIRYGYQI
ncbi:hypothetical protein FC19_GL001661 [Liquorilactobacillus aquaticus DSM 21051]|uniref:Bacteriocin immunity protein n=1 Tax=Liquorilactobacillus aquaticus DSM 21051 TaxID=1423725 RepID=A0A0R2DAJ7_9LACO|nr:bacteriocin immunity protein [Liquorilactobacillus aquaticus]KRM97611.1 hypothetical protein FC19_GL001661 [Liquorilactobacillus aquaticus DSM 21051]